MNKQHDKEALMQFLDWTGEKGLTPINTVQSRKAAVNKVLSVLADDEVTDVTKIDVDDLMDRFINLNRDGYSPESLRAYRSRVGKSIDEFSAYLENPMAFKPSSQRRRTRKLRLPSSATGKIGKTASPQGQPADSAPYKAPSVATSIIPIPIRADLTVHIQGIPFDMTQGEARRIANVIVALASEEH
ncbi:hypothetical protein [uncultured Maricaulis sp.]|uniref:hypothetical protein n=1 Tax=uncultured Maricaulis sp. TaxID=174710 RepID=UPI0030DA3A71|tara:strand:- start:1199 stop:1759 length:561 start_codon:yes stop_codon:yes gene_type:complete